MAGTISENYESRSFTIGQSVGRELLYNITGATAETDAEALLTATVPATYQGLILESIAAESLGNGVWRGSAKYVRQSVEYSFDTGGGTQKITQSIATIASYAPAGMTAPDFDGAIGVSEDSVEGVDVPVRAYQFSETYQLTDSEVATLRPNLFLLTGCINDDSFRGLAAGECLFLGATGSKRGDELWTVTFKFAGSPNATGLTVGTITGIAKLGWDYLWVRYADYADTSAHALVKRPVAAYVERVSYPGDFSLLGIGTT